MELIYAILAPFLRDADLSTTDPYSDASSFQIRRLDWKYLMIVFLYHKNSFSGIQNDKDNKSMTNSQFALLQTITIKELKDPSDMKGTTAIS